MLIKDVMETKPCKCGSTLEQIINAEQKVRVGWWCRKCDAFEKAILRERVLCTNTDVLSDPSLTGTA
jgi:hypothetical protein